ncbi:related to FMC1-mitochondrial matrix protein, required for assembly of F1F0 ATP synthase [Sporisorium reilianum f. sp. reilianum]|uniref:Related to FMC1-mitochondrial matrix protein, required for assembly of F1F0 ATP synthase n=1 Tax=Sporisorium reilianum f. sp. reilianum TaxID=72559 RepID=A0A2N8UM02_9BASI|nr:related to FMC1-mitochondrial matrix protein, required for assembly of F1F0 ATP synthase [Sporisorium reilianum f. sp. reilianum]
MFASATKSSAVKTLYQNVLKEAERSAKDGPLVAYLQKEFKDVESGALSSPQKPASASDYTPFIAPDKTPAQLRQQTLENLNVFLQNKALHAELLQRYNPTVGMTEEERVRLTARRVGLDVPVTHDGTSEASSNNYRESAQIAQDQYKQDKDNREDQLYSGKGDGLNVGGPLRPPVPKD